MIKLKPGTSYLTAESVVITTSSKEVKNQVFFETNFSYEGQNIEYYHTSDKSVRVLSGTTKDTFLSEKYRPIKVVTKEKNPEYFL